MCGFNILASKIASIFLGACLLLTLWWAKNWLTRGIGIAFIAVMVFLWWLAHGVGLKYFVLFIGYGRPRGHTFSGNLSDNNVASNRVMSCLYCLWDILDDLVFRKAHESDASRFAQLCEPPCLSSQAWGVLWFLVSLVFFAAGIIIGIVAFKGTLVTYTSERVYLLTLH